MYKCSLCGEKFQRGDAKNMPKKNFSAMMDKIHKDLLTDTFNDNQRRYPLHVMHHYKDGSIGVAYFAGFKNRGGDSDERYHAKHQ
jgi:hypothetical protein